MRKNFGIKTYLYPQPVLIIGTYDNNMVPNAMNAAWGGICDYNKLFIALSSHKSTENILKNRAFTVSIGVKEEVEACDYVGLVSGNKVANKVEKAGFTPIKSEYVNAPIFEELPLTFECRFVSYEDEILVGEIVNVSIDEKILGPDGEPDLSKFSPLTYDPVHHQYITLGDVVGKAFKIGDSKK